ncbi:MAG TPA: ATP-binding cassette domain-containing protein [Acidimicrobiia bacterium]|nr:ATP-binding cassette domain-containing protein [Acidimicrobiia bacterium]
MIRFDDVTITYAGSATPVITNATFAIDAGELCVVIGSTGIGKSTLLGAINGLVPHFTGGDVRGTVTVDGRATRTHPPRDLADVVGYVSQQPIAGCVTDSVEEELAYVMEQLAISPPVMRRRIEEVLDVLGLAHVRSRALSELSGGQLQRAAIGAALTAHPRVLVLDEPTSALDPVAAEDVLAAITRLVHDLGITVVLAEHRLERVVHVADRVINLPGNGRVEVGDPSAVLGRARVAPPIVELGRAAGWEPLPLSVRDARRAAAPLRARLDDVVPPPVHPIADVRVPVLRAEGVTVRYDDVIAVRDLGLEIYAGEITALMGRNGSGKSSLLWALQGSGRRSSGRVDVDGLDPASRPPHDARALVGLVPESATDLLYLDTVGEELAQADTESGAPAGYARRLLDRMVPGISDATNPRDCSAGQQLALVCAVQLAAAPRVLLLDEPTRGLDYDAKHHLASMLDDLAADGHAIVVSTHDVEFVARATHRVLLMAEGELIGDGPTAEVVVGSPSYAPQITKILAPHPWLTVEQLRAAGALTPESVAP